MSSIEVQHAAADRVARIVVADNGPGIPAGEREKLFMPYYSTKRRGSGLGLAIVRRIIAEHGGTHRRGRQRAERHAVHHRAAGVREARSHESGERIEDMPIDDRRHRLPLQPAA